MQDLIKQIVERTGIPEAVATQVVNIVVDFLKNKLPAPIAQQLEGVLQGKDVDAGGLLGGLGNILGGKK